MVDLLGLGDELLDLGIDVRGELGLFEDTGMGDVVG